MVSIKITDKFRIKCKIYQTPKYTCHGKFHHNLLKKEEEKRKKAKFTLTILNYT